MTAFHAFFVSLYDRMEIKEILENTLRKEPNLLSDKGEIKKWVVINKAQNYDETLLGLLLDEPRLKTIFFKEIKNALVFNLNLFTDFIEQKEFLPDSYTGFPNKIGLQIGGKFLRQRNEVSLVWPYKDCVLEGGQSREEDTRKEIFFNELLAQDEITQLFEPKVITNIQYFGDTKELTPTSNLLIKGNNLLALHSLKKRFTGKVKLIYIDPPYNTGSDSFQYNDSFNHSSWLTFMKNRLDVAKTLLSEDGVIFIQCDDNEQAYLKVLCDDIFTNNYLVTFFIQVRYSGKTLVEDMDFQKLIETIHVYKKSSIGRLKKEELDYSIDKFIWKVEEGSINKTIELGGKKVDIFEKGQYKFVKNEPSLDNLKEIWASGKVLDGNSSGRFFRDNLEGRSLDDGLGVLYKVHGIGDDSFSYRYFTGPQRENATKGKYYQGVPNGRLDSTKEQKRYAPVNNFYDLSDSFGNCRQEGQVELRSGKKPEELLKKIIELATEEGDIVLDYHLGSGTTAATALKLNRRFIGIEQMDYEQNDSTIRLKNVINGEQSGISKTVNWQGGGSFIYLELKKYNESFVEKISDCQSTDELLEVWEEMKNVSFLNYNIDIKDQNKAIEELKTHSLEVQKQKLVSILDKNQLYVSVSNMDDAQYGVTTEEKEFTKAFYQND